MLIEGIDSCRVCGNKELVPVLDLGLHYLSGRFPGPNEKDPPRTPLQLVRCDNSQNHSRCGLLQLEHRVEPGELYSHHYGYKSGTNESMRAHLEEVLEEIETRSRLRAGDVVLDVGSNDGFFLRKYSIPGIRRIGIDPTGNQFRRLYPDNITLLADFFTAGNFRKVSDSPAKVISSIAMFYDLPDPCGFAKDVSKCLDQDGIWVFEQSYMPAMLATNSFDTICHEHLEYYGLHQILHILKTADMKAVDVAFNDTNGGSFRVTAAHNSYDIRPSSNIEKALVGERAMGLDTARPYEIFNENVERVKNELVSFVETERAKGKSFYLYGASTKGNTLLQYLGLGKDHFTAAAERNPEKYGRRTPGTNIPIIPEDEVRNAKPDYMLVLPWHFKRGIIKREADYLDSGGHLIFPLPKFEVVGAKDVRT